VYVGVVKRKDRVWCQRKYDAGYDSPCGFGSPYVSRRVCKKCEYFKGKCKYPVLRGLLQNLVELVKVRLRVLTRRLMGKALKWKCNMIVCGVFGV